MEKDMQSLLDRYVSAVQNIYGSHIKSIILYGSYARGDFSPESDIDIMILVDLAPENIERYSDALSKPDFEYNVSGGLWFMPVVTNIDHFNHWREALPFYSNIEKERVLLYEAA